MKRKNPSKYLRSWEDIKDVFPNRGGLDGSLIDEKRGVAIFDVYQRISDKDFKELCRKDDNNLFQWFIPDYGALALCRPFFMNYPEGPLSPDSELILKPRAEVIYLDPQLEDLDIDIAVVVVAHEIAHLVLDHKTVVGSEYEKQEKEAWDLVKKWGFQRELKKYTAFRKRTP